MRPCLVIHARWDHCGRFVAYHGLQCYPEYLVYYERVHEGENGEHDTTSQCATPARKALSESKMAETSEARQLREQRERVVALREESAQGQISLLELENLNNWFKFRLEKQERKILKLRGMSEKPKTDCLGVNFTVAALERAFRVKHMRT